jgi:hypothetical protein
MNYQIYFKESMFQVIVRPNKSAALPQKLSISLKTGECLFAEPIVYKLLGCYPVQVNDQIQTVFILLPNHDCSNCSIGATSRRQLKSF